MIFNGGVLAWSGFYGGTVGNTLARLEQLGVFEYVLPFLIIFAVVFNILSRMKLFGENKAISAVISFAVGLMALQMDFVSTFFSEIFPRLGVGLSVILVILICIGLFVDDKEGKTKKALIVIGVAVAIFILYTTYGALGYSGGIDWNVDLTEVGLGILFLAIMAWVVFRGGGNGSDKGTTISVPRAG